MKKNWRRKLGVLLLLSSLAIYSTHFILFKDAEFVVKLFLAQAGYLPFSTFVVGFIINKFISNREKEQKEKKLYMLISVFFIEIGTDLIQVFNKMNDEHDQICETCAYASEWEDNDVDAIEHSIDNLSFSIQSSDTNIELLRAALFNKKENLLHLMQNPYLLEHDQMTDALWSVIHLIEELTIKGALSEEDRDHIALDVSRAYRNISSMWIKHMRHLRKSYPYLYSRAIKMNPYDMSRSACEGDKKTCRRKAC